MEFDSKLLKLLKSQEPILGRWFINENMVLGGGENSIVYPLLQNKISVEQYVIKILYIEDESQEKRVQKEITTMYKLNKVENVVKFIDTGGIEIPDAEGKRLYFYIMPRYINLNEYLKNNSLSEKEIYTLAENIASAIYELHKMGTIHMDIKPDNIFVDKKADGEISFKLGDFGIATDKKKTKKNLFAGTRAYMAPESIIRGEYSIKTDIYSFGLTLYSILNDNKLPFEDSYNLIKAIDKRNNGDEFPAPKNGDQRLKAVVMSCCEYKPEKRRNSMRQVLDGINRGKQEIIDEKYEDLYRTVYSENTEAEKIPESTPIEISKPKTKGKKKTVVIVSMVIVIAAILAGSFGVYFFLNNSSPENKFFNTLNSVEREKLISKEDSSFKTQKTELKNYFLSCKSLSKAFVAKVESEMETIRRECLDGKNMYFNENKLFLLKTSMGELSESGKLKGIKGYKEQYLKNVATNYLFSHFLNISTLALKKADYPAVMYNYINSYTLMRKHGIYGTEDYVRKKVLKLRTDFIKALKTDKFSKSEKCNSIFYYVVCSSEDYWSYHSDKLDSDSSNEINEWKIYNDFLKKRYKDDEIKKLAFENYENYSKVVSPEEYCNIHKMYNNITPYNIFDEILKKSRGFTYDDIYSHYVIIYSQALNEYVDEICDRIFNLDKDSTDYYNVKDHFDKTIKYSKINDNYFSGFKYVDDDDIGIFTSGEFHEKLNRYKTQLSNYEKSIIQLDELIKDDTITSDAKKSGRDLVFDHKLINDSSWYDYKHNRKYDLNFDVYFNIDLRPYSSQKRFGCDIINKFADLPFVVNINLAENYVDEGHTYTYKVKFNNKKHINLPLKGYKFLTIYFKFKNLNISEYNDYKRKIENATENENITLKNIGLYK